MILNKSINLITRTMGRLSFLEKSLPSWCLIKEIDKIVIVDWGMKEDVLHLLKIDDRITLIRVSDQKYFETGATRNVGVKFSNSDYIFMIDCDTLLEKNPFELVKDDNSFFVFKQQKWETGTCLFPKHMWKSVNGYLEGVPSWGDEDVNFYERAIKNGYKKVVLIDFIKHQEHPNKLRLQNLLDKGDLKDLNKAILVNRKFMSEIKENKMKQYVCQVVNKKESKTELI
jgi:hypothetical protein